MEQKLPYKAEYAKSSRASCKACKMSIGKDSLRIGVMVQSHVFDGMIPNWHHMACFFRKNKPKAVTEIEHFDQLRWDDQKKIKDTVEGAGAAGSSKDDGKGKGIEMTSYAVEYAKSNRSTCKGCDETITKGDLRMSVKEAEPRFGLLDQWHHVQCFDDNRKELKLPDDFDVTSVPGFTYLKDDDRAALKKRFKVKESKKRKAEDDAVGGEAKKPKVDSEHEKAIKEQSELLWKIRDQLSAQVSNNALKGLLEYNHQKLPTGESALLDRVSDAMAFGPLKPCPECEGQLVYSQFGYKCTGMITEWTKCTHTTRKVKRGKFKIPEQYLDVNVLKSFKFKKRERLFAFDETTAALASQPSMESGGVGDPNKPLAGMKFAVASGVTFKSGRTKAELEKALIALGGTIVKKVGSGVAAVIGTQEAVDALKPKVISLAKSADVHVVEENFVDEVKKGGAVQFIQSLALSPWGSDPLSRIDDVITAKSGTVLGKSKGSKSAEERFKKELSTIKMKVKGGAAVDPDSNLEDEAHLMQEPNGDPLNAVLGMVDLVRGSNSYYKLQALAADNGRGWWVFRSWGRIGTSIGGTKTERFGSDLSARESFCDIYFDKTGNDWDQRKNFEKKVHKFFPLEMDYGEDDDSSKKLDASKSSSTLPKSVQALIQFIFDIDSMKEAMKEFEIDLKKMPLGKLSRNQVENAYKVLTELQGLIESGGSKARILDATTRFFTLIPHDFGMRNAPLLDSKEVIKAKTEMLDSLLEIEIAYSMMKTGAGEDPIDAHYKKLNTGIEPLDPKSEEYKRIVDYVANTHAPTHSSYNLEVQNIFELKRQGEDARYKPFMKMPNRKLLWHGSRRTNWAGILSQGLRIAPPEAPVTGYMFGKGIYFADMVSKSANYCFTNRAAPLGLMLLCEVALGTMTERTCADCNIKLKPGEHSCKGIGRTHPDPSGEYVNPDGVVYPMGKHTQDSGIYSHLLYNEYIVYDVAQARQKYLLLMNFKYK